MKKKRRQKRVLAVLITFNLITLSFFSLLFYQSSQFDMPVYSQLKVNSAVNYFQTNYVVSPSKQQQVEDIFALYNKRAKILYKNIRAYGKAIPILNIVILDAHIPINSFAKVLAHELEHLKYDFVEHRVEYHAIIKLWESGVPYLKYQAYLGAKTVLEGRLGKRYDCSNALIEYFNQI